MIVYEDEDVREDGLQILANLARSSEETMTQVTDALLASVESGFSHELQQRLRTVSFVRSIWDGRCLDVSWALASSHIPPLYQIPRAPSTPLPADVYLAWLGLA
jgi:DNA-binding transcriptional ArsR family regulator